MVTSTLAVLLSLTACVHFHQANGGGKYPEQSESGRAPVEEPGAGHEGLPPVPRLVVRNATLYASGAVGDGAPRRSMTIAIDNGTITSVAPTVDGDLAPGDTLVDCQGRFVIPGLIEGTGVANPSYATAARRTVEGVTTLAGPWTVAERSWFAQVGLTASFAMPDVVHADAAIGATETIAWVESHASRAARARQVAEWTSLRAKRLGLEDRGAIEPGLRADLLVLADDPFDDLSTVRRPWQMIVGGRPLRIAQLETARQMQERAARFVESAPPASPGSTRFLIESSGLLVGRLDFAASEPEGASRGVERWGPPIDIETEWRYSSTQGGPEPAWDALLQYRRGPMAGLRVELTSADGTLRASVEERTEPAAEPGEVVKGEVGKEAPIAPRPAESQQTDVEVRVDAPTFDPVSLVTWMGGRLEPLAEGQSIPLHLAEVVPQGGRLTIGVREVSIGRTALERCPLPSSSMARAFRIADASGATLGLVIVDVSPAPRNEPRTNAAAAFQVVRAALFAPDGITEYRLIQPRIDGSPVNR